MPTSFWYGNEDFVRRILPLEVSMFLRKTKECHGRSKTRYEGAIVDTERLAEEERTVERKKKSDQESHRLILGVCLASSSHLSPNSHHA